MDTPAVLVGTSAAIRDIEEEANHAAHSDTRVLLTGESGVGKESLARLIHERSGRARRQLVAVDGASFTRALRDRRQPFEAADGGTIVIDEVGAMSPCEQSALGRFLETGEVLAAADELLPSIDSRVIATTTRPLVDAVAANTFRADLYYRLNVVHIEIPPLRERCEDVPALLDHFLQSFAESRRCSVPEVRIAAVQRLMAYRWPGNVRELKNVAERLVLERCSGRIDVEALPPEIVRSSPALGVPAA